jgi:hypothetical protein
MRKTKNYDDSVNTMCRCQRPAGFACRTAEEPVPPATQQANDYAGMVKWWCVLTVTT